MSRESFVELMRNAILSLPQDLKTMLRLVEDPDIDDDSRVAAAGALIHVLSASNAIPGMRGILAYVDDVIVLRLVLQRIREKSPEAMAPHVREAPELLEDLEEQIATIHGFLGDLNVVLERAADGVPSLSYQGHSARECTFDTEGSTWLYDTVLEAIVRELEFDEDDVVRETKQIDQILPHLRTRVASLRA